MVKCTAKVDLRRLKAKVKKWESQLDEESVAALKDFGKEAAKAMMKCTPPGNMKQKPVEALAALKKRIKEDFEGEGTVPFDDEDIFWFTNANGDRVARFGNYEGGRVSPFRVMRGRVSQKKLDALHVGKFRVRFIDDVGAWMKKSGQYYMRWRGSAWRLNWVGTRHVTTQAAMNREIRRRQRLAGSLMAGWKALAHEVGAKLPAAVERQAGRGTAKMKKSQLHKATLEARNRGKYPELQVLVDRQMPYLRKRNKQILKKRMKKMKLGK